jgi:hypothetical protein
MPWVKDDRLSNLLEKLGLTEFPQECYDCGAKPGECHEPGCFKERCSVCGDQHVLCDCEGHDPGFARWTGFMPGALEALALGLVDHWEGAGSVTNKTCVVGMNDFMVKWSHLFFIKPAPPKPPADDIQTVEAL